MRLPFVIGLLGGNLAELRLSKGRIAIVFIITERMKR